MNYHNQDLLDKLASEYVLGTLSGLARMRFEKLLIESLDARLAVWSWEAQINPMVDCLPDKTPPKRVWKKIRQSVSRDAQTKTRRSLNFWQGWGMIAAASLMLMVAVFVVRPFAPMSADYMAVFNNNQAQPVWVITGDLHSGELQINAVNTEAERLDQQAYEMWMLPADGSPPVSMGLMPVNDKKAIILSPQILTVLQQAKGLAISQEPPGGSPTGQPTGPVVYQSEIVTL